MITSVEEAQHELNVAVQEIIEDMGDDAPDEGSATLDLWYSMSINWSDDIAHEVARREFGYVPGTSGLGHIDWDDIPMTGSTW